METKISKWDSLLDRAAFVFRRKIASKQRKPKSRSAILWFIIPVGISYIFESHAQSSSFNESTYYLIDADKFQCTKSPNYKAAMQLEENALNADPGNLEAYDLLGQALYQQRETSAAISVYKTAIDIAERHNLLQNSNSLLNLLFPVRLTNADLIKPELYKHLGDALLQNGNGKEAVQAWQSAIGAGTMQYETIDLENKIAKVLTKT